MTDYKKLSDQEQRDVLQEIQKEFDYPQCADAIIDVVSGHACASCYMAYYNCLCGHDAE